MYFFIDMYFHDNLDVLECCSTFISYILKNKTITKLWSSTRFNHVLVYLNYLPSLYTQLKNDNHLILITCSQDHIY